MSRFGHPTMTLTSDDFRAFATEYVGIVVVVVVVVVVIVIVIVVGIGIVVVVVVVVVTIVVVVVAVVFRGHHANRRYTLRHTGMRSFHGSSCETTKACSFARACVCMVHY